MLARTLTAWVRVVLCGSPVCMSTPCATTRGSGAWACASAVPGSDAMTRSAATPRAAMVRIISVLPPCRGLWDLPGEGVGVAAGLRGGPVDADVVHAHEADGPPAQESWRTKPTLASFVPMVRDRRGPCQGRMDVMRYPATLAVTQHDARMLEC